MRSLRSLIPWLALGASSFSVFAGLAAAAPSPSDDLAARQVRAHTTFLADDLLEGRGTGTRGHALAARYVASQFLRLGLQPAGDAGTFDQTVPLIEATEQIESGRFSLRRTGAPDVSLQASTDVIVRVAAGQTEGRIEAPAVFIGYGVQAPEFDHDDFQGIDLTGKIAVVLSGAPTRFPADPRAYHASEKLTGIAARGAVGVVTLITPRDLAQAPWAFVAAQSRFPRMRLLDAQGRIVDSTPGLKVTAVVGTHAANTLFAGTAHTAEALFAAAEAGPTPRFALDATIELSAAATFHRIESLNVLGLLPGSDSRLAGEPIVITAHLDHLGIGPEVKGDKLYNGAMDNAIGTALLLVMAEQIAAGAPLRRPLLFAAVTAEEKGLLGARHLSLNRPAGVARYLANVNFDMAMFPVPTRELVGWGAIHSSLGATLAEAAGRQQFTVSPDPIPDEAIFVRSDQYAFIREGVPSLFLSTWPTVDPTGPAGSDPSGRFLQERYHKPNDDLHQPIDWPSTGAFVRVARDLVQTVAEAPEPPDWLPGNFFGLTFGPKHR
jgi:Zn-dependent M28 family amino/carboxypeptidase